MVYTGHKIYQPVPLIKILLTDSKVHITLSLRLLVYGSGFIFTLIDFKICPVFLFNMFHKVHVWIIGTVSIIQFFFSNSQIVRHYDKNIDDKYGTHPSSISNAFYCAFLLLFFFLSLV